MNHIKRVKLHEMITDELKKYIKSNQLKKGDRLPSVAELTKLLGVSRSSLREALRFLEGINVIDIQNGKGIFVKDGDLLRIEATVEIENEKKLLLHISEVRRALEGKAVELAAIRATPSQIKKMENYLNEAIRLSKNKEDSSETDLNFHKAIYEATQNPVLQSVVESLWDIFIKFWKKPFGIDEIFNDTYPTHQTLLEAIKQRNPDLALKEFNKIVDSVELTVKKVQ